MTRSLSVLSALVLIVPTSALAAGLIEKLPEDGTWARFHWNAVLLPQEERISGEVLLSSVGTATEQGKKCRWIELRLKREQNGQEELELFKLLVPEEELRAKRDPLAHVVRGYQRRGNEEPQRLELDGAIALRFFLAGPLQPQPLDEPRTVEYQRGRLQSDRAWQGGREFRFGENTIEIKSKLWPHADTPFGLAALNQDATARNGDDTLFRALVDTMLLDFGDHARSELPDHQ